jgi:hypothetical protein
MKSMRRITIVLIMLLVLCSGEMTVIASDQISETIDQENWQSIKGLVPDAVLKRVQSGDYVFHLAKIDFNPAGYQAPWIVASLSENRGKYAVNDKDEIVDAKTGQRVNFVKGIPFPPQDIKANDPKAVQKIMHNGFITRDCYGPMNTRKQRLVQLFHKKYDRHVQIQYWMQSYLGVPLSKGIPNSQSYENTSLILVTEPYDMAGTAMMTWRYQTDQPDTLFGYVPAIRRVRRMTPAGRSDSLFGTDFVRDDGNWTGFDGKIPEFEWRLIGEKDVLAEFLAPEVSRAVKNEKGAWKAEDGGPEYPLFGFEKDGWKGASWWNTKAVWVKRPVWVIVGQSKNPYYNYGKMTFYIDKELHIGYWKEIYDRSGQYWKTNSVSTFFMNSDDDSFRANLVGYWRIVDEKKNHATLVLQHVEDEFQWTLLAQDVDPKDFTVAGFQRLAK